MPMAAKKATRKIDVGTKIFIIVGDREISAVVVEDRGNVGSGGRRLFRVAVHLAEVDEPLVYEVAEADARAA